MKTLIASVFILVAGIAHAGEVDLYTHGGFGALHQYHNVDTSLCTTVPCDPLDQVTIYLPQAPYPPNGGMQLWFGNQVNQTTYYFLSYWIGSYAGNGAVSMLQKCVFPMDPTNSYSTGPCVLNGETIQVTLNETSRVVRGSGSGRGGYTSHTVWTLLSGTIISP